MNRNSTLKEISNRLLQLLPLKGNLKSQIQSKINSALKSTFEEFGIITKEELEQERIALQRAMIRIAELEKQLSGLESELRKRN
tara:strand:+ start:740 stop:991 length:252 start_codon:yes stop_codon:yes gene_type:complete